MTNSLIVDTREQLPLFLEEQGAIREKLDVGDYTTTSLKGILHIERKSPGDLYGSIIQGHDRFRKEMMRAKASKVKLVIMVECPHHTFVKKEWNVNARKLLTPGKTLAKILETIESKYDIEIIWCNDRQDMRRKLMKMFENEINTQNLEAKP